MVGGSASPLGDRKGVSAARLHGPFCLFIKKSPQTGCGDRDARSDQRLSPLNLPATREPST
jgi:hypothetical protein